MFVIRLRLQAKPMIGMEKMNNNNVFSNMLNVKRMLLVMFTNNSFKVSLKVTFHKLSFTLSSLWFITCINVWHEILLLSNNNWYINLICSKIDDKFIKDKLSA